jgi:primosomal protein N' (replication factor Y)
MCHCVDVILPIPVNQKFTYSVSEEEFNFIKPGMRIIVPFGKTKLYTSIAFKLHRNNNYTIKLKSIVQIIDNTPTVNNFQLNFWDWISRYYFAPIGDIMRASLPSNLVLQSETEVSLNQNQIINQNNCDDLEYLILDALKIKKNLSVKEISEIVGKKNIFPILNSMREKNFILIDEKVYGKYSPKFIRCVRLSKNFNKDLILSIPKNAKNQIKFYEYYLENKLKSNKNIRLSDFKNLNKSYHYILNKMVEKKIFEFYEIEISRNIVESKKKLNKIELSKKQLYVLNEIKNNFNLNKNVLLKGVTASGKTEIYISLIKQYLNSGNQILYLVPEIALTTQLVDRLSHFFSDNLLVYHSALSLNQRAELWFKINQNKTNQVVIGARSAIFLPFSRLKLIIIDEEHEQSFKQFEPSPRYHARDSALVLSKLHRSNVLMGTATPSIESYYNSTSLQKFSLVELNERYGKSPLPKINIIDIKHMVKEGKMYGFFSEPLLAKIKEVVSNNKQVIIFQNRRGFSPVLECNSCGFTPKCINCDVSLTFHYSKKSLRCHYCGYHENIQENCVKCGSSDIISRGLGTEQIEIELKNLFPKIRIVRLDHDTTRGKNSFKKIISSFENKDFDLMVGTQMITKGLDFKNVQLVGIMNLESSMNFPDFRSNERCFQLVQQVAGRAGRATERGEVFIQTYNSNPKLVNQIVNGDYEKFFQIQINDREKFKYPPFSKLIQLTVKHKNLNVVNKSSKWLFDKLFYHFKGYLLGPEFPYISRVRNKYQKNILIKIPHDFALSGVKLIIKKYIQTFKLIPDYRAVQVIVDVDPN